MPGLNGFEVTEIIKSNNQTRQIPVIAFTASTMSDDTERLNKTFDAYLLKPVFKKDVMAVLSKFLSHKYQKSQKPLSTVDLDTHSFESTEFFPEIITHLENNFLFRWENIKNDLIIFDIEEFNDQLIAYASKYSCRILDHFCAELSQGLQSFDIEQIKTKLNEFPQMIKELKDLIR
jgi:response regulator RpfG family c-di-GMP phosphodiesterase